MSNSNFDGKLPPEFWDLASVKDVTIPKELSKPVVGYDFAKCDGAVDYDSLLTEYASSTGLQATFFGKVSSMHDFFGRPFLDFIIMTINKKLHPSGWEFNENSQTNYAYSREYLNWLLPRSVKVTIIATIIMHGFIQEFCKSRSLNFLNVIAVVLQKLILGMV